MPGLPQQLLTHYTADNRVCSLYNNSLFFSPCTLGANLGDCCMLTAFHDTALDSPSS